jgi:8-oxo-dGTP pyrophosphatase MutT (NUDIX family)
MTPAEMREWITRCLDPLESYDPARPAAYAELGPHPDAPGDGEALKAAAVLIPLVEHEAGVTVLLTRRSDTLRSHTGQIAFPGGRTDPGETPWAAALREAEEEIGLDREHVTLAGLSSGYQTGSGYDITPVVGFVRPGFHLNPNPQEVADVFEAPFAFLMDPGNHERRFREQSDGLRRYFYAMPYEDRQIWGATAGMLRALYERLYGAPAANDDQ